MKPTFSWREGALEGGSAVSKRKKKLTLWCLVSRVARVYLVRNATFTLSNLGAW